MSGQPTLRPYNWYIDLLVEERIADFFNDPEWCKQVCTAVRILDLRDLCNARATSHYFIIPYISTSSYAPST